MRFFVGDEGYEDGELASERAINELREQVQSVLPGAKLLVTSSDLGHGADWPTLTVVIGSVSAFLMAGKPMREGIKEWIELSKDAVSLYNHLRKRYKGVRIDSEAACLMALDTAFGDDFPEESTLQVSINTFSGQTPRGHFAVWNDVADYPEQVHVITIAVFTDAVSKMYPATVSEAFLIVIKSTGEVSANMKLPSLDWMTFNESQIEVRRLNSD